MSSKISTEGNSIPENKSNKKKYKKNALEYIDLNMEKKKDPKYKTEVCLTFSENGFCPYGNLCRFAHGKNQLFQKDSNHPNYKKKDCLTFHLYSYCNYGARCHFRHSYEFNKIPRSFYRLLLMIYSCEKENIEIINGRLNFNQKINDCFIFENILGNKILENQKNDFKLNFESRKINNENLNKNKNYKFNKRLNIFRRITCDLNENKNLYKNNFCDMTKNKFFSKNNFIMKNITEKNFDKFYIPRNLRDDNELRETNKIQENFDKYKKDISIDNLKSNYKFEEIYHNKNKNENKKNYNFINNLRNEELKKEQNFFQNFLFIINEKIKTSNFEKKIDFNINNLNLVKNIKDENINNQNETDNSKINIPIVERNSLENKNLILKNPNIEKEINSSNFFNMLENFDVINKSFYNSSFEFSKEKIHSNYISHKSNNKLLNSTKNHYTDIRNSNKSTFISNNVVSNTISSCDEDFSRKKIVYNNQQNFSFNKTLNHNNMLIKDNLDLSKEKIQSITCNNIPNSEYKNISHKNNYNLNLNNVNFSTTSQFNEIDLTFKSFNKGINYCKYEFNNKSPSKFENSLCSLVNYNNLDINHHEIFSNIENIDFYNISPKMSFDSNDDIFTQKNIILDEFNSIEHKQYIFSDTSFNKKSENLIIDNNNILCPNLIFDFNENSFNKKNK